MILFLLGKELSQMLGSLTAWTEDNMQTIIQSEKDFISNQIE
jgi:hypothetical protein